MASHPSNFDATSTWTALPHRRADHVSILNSTESDLEIRRGDSADSMLLAAGKSAGLRLVVSTSEIQVKGDGNIQLIIES
jgi:hypothetical protein